MTEQVQITVRYFAAAESAAGTDTESLTLSPGATVAELVAWLGDRDDRLATVLARCSYLCDGIAVRDHGQPLRPGDTVDVLPPFAGG